MISTTIVQDYSVVSGPSARYVKDRETLATTDNPYKAARFKTWDQAMAWIVESRIQTYRAVEFTISTWGPPS